MILTRLQEQFNHHLYHHHHQHHQHLRSRPCDLFQFRITSEIMNLLDILVGSSGRGNSPTQGLYLHITPQHRKTRTKIYALSGLRTHDQRKDCTVKTAAKSVP
jgi:hypothetical protein